MATFAENAVETMTVDLNCNNEIFITRGTRTIEKGGTNSMILCKTGRNRAQI